MTDSNIGKIVTSCHIASIKYFINVKKHGCTIQQAILASLPRSVLHTAPHYHIRCTSESKTTCSLMVTQFLNIYRLK